MKPLICTQCNAPLDIKSRQKVHFCPFCGTPISMYDMSSKVDVDIEYRGTQVIHDEAEIERVRESEKRKRHSAILRDIILFIWIISIIIFWFSDEWQPMSILIFIFGGIAVLIILLIIRRW